MQSSEEDEDNAPPAAPDDMDGSSDLDINSSTTISQLSPAAQAVAMSMIEMLREIKRSKGDFKMTEYQIVGAALMALDPVAAARSSDVMDTGDDDQEPQQTATDDMEYNLCCDGTGVGKTATMLLAAVWRARQTKSTPPGSIVTVLPTPVYRASLICSPNSEVMEQSYLMARRMGVRQSEMAIYPPVKGKPSTPFANCLLVFTTHSCVSNEFAFAPFLYDPAARNTVRAADVSASTANEALKATLEWRAKAAKRVEDGKREPSLLFPSSLDAYADDAPKIWNSVFYDEIHIVGGGVAKKRSSDPNKQPEEVVLERASKRAFVSARTLRKLCSRMYGMTASPLGNTVMDTPVICALCANRSRTTGHNPLIRRTFFTPGVSEQLALIGISAPTPPNVIRVSVLIPEGPEEQTMSKIEESLISALQDQRELSAKGDQGGIGQTMKMMVKADTATMSLMQHAEGASDSPDTKKIVSSVEGAVMDQAVKYVNKSTAIRVPGAKMRPIVVAASYKEHMNRLAYLIELYKEQGKLPGFLTHAIYHGELSPSARQEMLNAYNNGDINVLILSTNIGRVGLNLQGPD
ncbi:MAG: hypothetical protein EBS90_10135, partial [Betaproteobacteria bacterium]|nr:hypothetical protein [Betaproteobacteria bacterium]